MPVTNGARDCCGQKPLRPVHYNALTLAIGAALLSAADPVCAADASAAPGGSAITFNSAFLMDGDEVDLSRYAAGNPVEAGPKQLDLVVNGVVLDRREIVFVSTDVPDHAAPCLTVNLLTVAGVRADVLANAPSGEAACIDLKALVPDATATYDSHALRLSLSLPQAVMANDPRGYVDPVLWNYGETASFLDYTLNAQRTRGNTNAYASLMGGLNLGAWRLRHRGSLQYSTRTDTHYQSFTNSLERDLPGWRSQLLVGQSYTSGLLFDGVGFVGAQVVSDDRMLPDALRGYAPVVRGMATTEARVTIRQNGYVLYEVSVAPGPFEINDLYPTSYGGDLEVTVHEADGREQRSTVNFAAVPQALREGVSRFSVTAGRLRMTQSRGGDKPLFTEGTWAHGMNNYLTLIGGAQLSNDYRAVLAGSAINTRWGAFGADMTVARATLQRRRSHNGSSFRLNYQRNFADAGTNFGLAAYRYSTEGFYTLAETTQSRGGEDVGYTLSRAKRRLQFNLSQRIGDRSSLYVSGGHVRDGSSRGTQTDYQIGFQSAVRTASYSISAMRTRDIVGRNDNSIQFTLSMPLGGSSRAPSLSTSLQRSRRDTSAQASINGTAGDRGNLGYNIGASQTRGDSASYYASASYTSALAQWSAMMARSQDATTTAIGASGAIVAHGGGINLSPTISDGFVLVEARGARGAYVGQGETRVARNGFAVVPQVTPYRWNSVSIDPQGLSHDVELLQTSQRVVPTAGAMVKLTFATKIDTTVYIHARAPDGPLDIPFGSDVRNEAGERVGTVGQGGMIRVQGDHKTLVVGQADTEQCRLDYAVPETSDTSGLRMTEAICHPGRIERPPVQAEASL